MNGSIRLEKIFMYKILYELYISRLLFYVNFYRLIAAGGENRVVKLFAALKHSFANVGVYVLSERAPLVDTLFFDAYNVSFEIASSYIIVNKC